MVFSMAWILVLLPVVFLAPNVQELARRFEPALDADVSAKRQGLAWMPTRRWAMVMAMVLAAGLLSMSRPSEFLYFQF